MSRNLAPAGRAGADVRIVAARLIAPVDIADNLRALRLVERCGILLVRVVARRVGRACELGQAEQNGASGHTRRNRIARAVAAVMMMVVAARRRCAPMLRCAVTGRVVGTVRGMGAGAAVPLGVGAAKEALARASDATAAIARTERERVDIDKLLETKSQMAPQSHALHPGQTVT